VLPEGQGGHVKRCQAEGRKVAMAGDASTMRAGAGQSDVGIAMAPHRCGNGECRRNAGQGRLARHRARRPSVARTMRNIRQKPRVRLCYNALAPGGRRRALPGFLACCLSPIFAVPPGN